ncbi:MAG: P1 family peptidase [Nitrospinota bacterium]|nr:P1 family peptidase [Nitrospinota bacterium]
MSFPTDPDPSSRLSWLPGVKVGHWTHPAGATGCTAIILDKLRPASVHVAGGAPGSQETDLLRPGMLVGALDAIMLSGGSAYGLDTAGGARRYLAEQERGFDAAGWKVPIVPAAIIFDLPTSGGVKPGAEEGYLACQAASLASPAEGLVGAGAGATVGKYLGRQSASPGGLASRAASLEGVSIGALVVANCFGAVWDPVSNLMIAGPRDGSGRPLDYLASPPSPPAFGATALGVIVTDAHLDPASAMRVAMMAHDGWARCVRPSHTPYDGDLIFVVSTGDKKIELARLGAMAAWLIERTTLAAVTRK